MVSKLSNSMYVKLTKSWIKQIPCYQDSKESAQLQRKATITKASEKECKYVTIQDEYLFLKIKVRRGHEIDDRLQEQAVAEERQLSRIFCFDLALC